MTRTRSPSTRFKFKFIETCDWKPDPWDKSGCFEAISDITQAPGLGQSYDQWYIPEISFLIPGQQKMSLQYLSLQNYPRNSCCYPGIRKESLGYLFRD